PSRRCVHLCRCPDRRRSGGAVDRGAWPVITPAAPASDRAQSARSYPADGCPPARRPAQALLILNRATPPARAGGVARCIGFIIERRPTTAYVPTGLATSLAALRTPAASARRTHQRPASRGLG